MFIKIDKDFIFPINDNIEENLKKIFNKNKKYVGIAPGAGENNKIWPIQNYINICNYLNQKGKKLPSYKDHFNQILLYLTSGYVLVRLETSIPSVQTNKTFPGCKKSFEGYPLFGDEDLSGLNYIACIAHKIKSSIEPWNTIRKLKEVSISQKIFF